MKRIFISAIIALALFVPAWSQDRLKNGEGMIDACRVIAMNAQPSPDIALRTGICVGEIDALSWTSSTLAGGAIRSCVPDEATRQEMAKVIIAFLEQHTDQLREPFQGFVLQAFAQAWPCQRSRKWFGK
jgi:hypothetical protein